MLGEARGNEGVVISHPPVGAEHPLACPQHGELRAYSSEGVGMNDGIERGPTERKCRAASKRNVIAMMQCEVQARNCAVTIAGRGTSVTTARHPLLSE